MVYGGIIMSGSPSVEEVVRILTLSPLYLQSGSSKRQEFFNYLSLILGNYPDRKVLGNLNTGPSIGNGPDSLDGLLAFDHQG
jgi:hypothetical protein